MLSRKGFDYTFSWHFVTYVLVNCKFWMHVNIWRPQKQNHAFKIAY